MRYQIRYGVVPSAEISDWILVKNPAYSVKKIAGYSVRSIVPDKKIREEMEQSCQFYTRLEQSILEHGFRNPIFCNSFDEGTFCRYGTTRLYFAKAHRLLIPVVVADYVDRFCWMRPLYSEEDIRSVYMDQPEVIEIGEEEMRIDKCPHVHLTPTTN